MFFEGQVIESFRRMSENVGNAAGIDMLPLILDTDSQIHIIRQVKDENGFDTGPEYAEPVVKKLTKEIEMLAQYVSDMPRYLPVLTELLVNPDTIREVLSNLTKGMSSGRNPA
jgi:hypothetical protein